MSYSSYEVFDDFGRRPMYEDFMEKTRQLANDGWQLRQFMTFTDFETGESLNYTYALTNGESVIVYNEEVGQAELLVFNETGFVLERRPIT